MIFFDIYEIRGDSKMLHGVKLRGRIRKFTIEKEITCLVENASDEKNVVRFAILTHSDPNLIVVFIENILSGIVVNKLVENVPNPVLSKLKVNDSSRYEI